MAQKKKAGLASKSLKQSLGEAREIQKRSEETIRQMRELMSKIQEARAKAEDQRGRDRDATR